MNPIYVIYLITQSMKHFYTLLLLLISFFSQAQTPQLKLTAIASGLFHPTNIASAGDGRLFVSQLDGKIQVVQNVIFKGNKVL